MSSQRSDCWGLDQERNNRTRTRMSPATQLFIYHVEPAQPGVTRLELLETDEAYVNQSSPSRISEMRLRLWAQEACLNRGYACHMWAFVHAASEQSGPGLAFQPVDEAPGRAWICTTPRGYSHLCPGLQQDASAQLDRALYPENEHLERREHLEPSERLRTAWTN